MIVQKVEELKEWAVESIEPFISVDQFWASLKKVEKKLEKDV